MSIFDEYQRKFGQLPDKEKLQILRPELLRRASFIKGYGELLHSLEQDKSLQLSADYGAWCRHIIVTAEEIEQIIYALTDRNS